MSVIFLIRGNWKYFKWRFRIRFIKSNDFEKLIYRFLIFGKIGNYLILLSLLLIFIELLVGTYAFIWVFSNNFLFHLIAITVTILEILSFFFCRFIFFCVCRIWADLIFYFFKGCFYDIIITLMPKRMR